MKDKLKEIRKKLHLTQEEFATKIGMTRNYIAQVETGKCAMSERTVNDICRIFHINEEWIKYGKGEMEALPEDEVAALVADILDDPESEVSKLVLSFIKTYQHLDIKNRKVIDNFISNMLKEQTKDQD